jgi:hypothetical protein
MTLPKINWSVKAGVSVALFFAVGLAGGGYLQNASKPAAQAASPPPQAPLANMAPAPGKPDPAPAEAPAAAPAAPPPPTPETVAAAAAPPPPPLQEEHAAREEAPIESPPAESAEADPSPPAGETPSAPAGAAKPAAAAAGAASEVAHPATKPARAAATHAALRQPAARVPPGAGPFQIQFGAFANEENAKRLVRAIASSRAKPEMVRGPGRAGRPVFYVRSAVFDDAQAATDAASDAVRAAQEAKFDDKVTYVILHGAAVPGPVAER